MHSSLHHSLPQGQQHCMTRRVCSCHLWKTHNTAQHLRIRESICISRDNISALPKQTASIDGLAALGLLGGAKYECGASQEMLLNTHTPHPKAQSRPLQLYTPHPHLFFPYSHSPPLAHPPTHPLIYTLYTVTQASEAAAVHI